jgi:surface antigen
MNRIIVIVLAALMLIVAIGCQTKERTGTLAGGAAGAVIGEQVGDSTAATLIGAVGGALLGREIGQRLDERDRQEVAEALETQETGESQAWTNPDTGERYEVTPIETFSRDGQPCRRFQMDVEGVDEEVTGTACRTAQGHWQIVG